MNVLVLGIDVDNAPVGVREKYSFTQAGVERALPAVKEASSCEAVLLTTCNRTELWLAWPGSENSPEHEHEPDPEAEPDPFAAMEAAGCPVADEDRPLFSLRKGPAAIEHLFETACGMRSAIFGEVQILTQVKKAADTARQAGSIGPVLASLFNRAVAGAKRVVASIPLATPDASAPGALIGAAIVEFGDLAGTNCLVVGSGEMGRMAAEGLHSAGGNVRMTIRSYKNGISSIPAGCLAVPYEDRYGYLDESDIIVSATASPHLTLEAKNMKLSPKKRLFVDLAVPRDMDGEIASLQGAILLNIDDIRGSARVDGAKLAMARQILAEEIEDFYAWHAFRALAPTVRDVCDITARDVCRRLSVQADVEGELYDAVYRSLSRILYGMKEYIDRDIWDDCYNSISLAARQEV